MSTRRVTQSILVVALVTAAAGCSDHRSTPPTATSTAVPVAPAAKAVVGSDGAVVGGRFGDVVVTAHAPAGVADVGAELAISEGDASPKFEAQLAAAPSVRITLGNGRQPKKPIALEFDLSNAPDLASKFTESTRPLVSIDAGSTNSDFIAAQWHPSTRTVTAATSHLSTFAMLVTDPVDALKKGFTDAWNSAHDTSGSKCVAGDTATVDGATLTLTPSKAGVVAACLRPIATGLNVDFDSTSRQYYTVTSKPSGTFTNTLPLHSSETIAVALGNSFRRATLTPSGRGSLVLPTGTTSGVVDLDVDPVALQLATILTGLNMYGLDSDALSVAFGTGSDLLDCTVTAYQSVTHPDKTSTEEFENSLGDIAQCASAAAQKAVGDGHTKILSKISTVTSLFTTLPSQLIANLTGIAGEFNGANHLEFALTRTAADASQIASAPTSSSPVDKTIDRVDVTSWAYDRVQGDTYVAANNNTKTLYIYWKSYAGEKQVRSGCTSTVKLTGSGATYTKHESNCDSYDPGTFLDVKAPGTYTANVVVHQDGHGDVTASREITILPFGS